MSEQRISIGRIVHYILAQDDHTRYPGEHRPAIVVKDNGGSVQLQVFVDGLNDRPGDGGPCLWKTSVLEDGAGKQPGTWHWPERT